MAAKSWAGSVASVCSTSVPAPLIWADSDLNGEPTFRAGGREARVSDLIDLLDRVDDLERSLCPECRERLEAVRAVRALKDRG